MIRIIFALLKILYELLRRIIFRQVLTRNEKKIGINISKEILGQQDLIAIDVGAANGLLPHWEFLDGIAHIIQIDPRIEACSELEDVRRNRADPKLYHIENVGLSEYGGKQILYVSNAPTGSSIFEIDPASHLDEGVYVDQQYFYPISKQIIETENLSRVINRLNFKSLDLIKLDVQGSELPILKGLESSQMSEVLAVELEVGLHTLYPEDVSYSSIDSYLKKNGLELFDIRISRAYRLMDDNQTGYQQAVFNVVSNSPTISARIWEFDAIYFRKQSSILANRNANEIRRMVLVYCTYNFYAEAYALVKKASKIEIFTKSEGDELMEEIVILHKVLNFREWFRADPGVEKILKIMYRISPRNAPRWCQYMYQSYPNG